MRIPKVPAIIALVLLLCVSGSANASIITFSRITSNASIDIAGQFELTVSDPGGGLARFRIANLGPVSSSITAVYFDDSYGDLAGSIAITNGPSVDFGTPAKPSNLPGANNASPSFETTGSLSAKSNPPVDGNGIHPAGWLILDVPLASGKTFSQVLADLSDNSLRIGLHVQSIQGASDSYVSVSSLTNPDLPEAPEPATLALLAIGAAALALRRTRQAR